MIRVLIVEDSATSRLLLQSILESDPAIHVVGTAADGAAGLQLAHTLKPDLITMDIRMPVMDGYEATRRIMEECPTAIVMVSQSVDAREPAIAFSAIQAGALTVVPTPHAPVHPDFAASRDVLLTTVRLMADVKVIRRRRRPGTAPLPVISPPPGTSHTSPLVVVIGASTGGPAALHLLLKALPADFRLPVVVVQHMSSGFIDSLTHWLQPDSLLRLSVAGEQHDIRPRNVYFAPDDRHLIFRSRGVLGLKDGPPVSYVRPSATVLFESAARIYGAEVVGVLLTGMGEDGARGLLEIRQRGGMTLAQDENTSVVYGMPKAARALGAVQRMLPLEQIGPALTALAERSERSTSIDS